VTRAAAGIPMSSHPMPEASTQVLAAAPTCHWLEYVDWADVLLRGSLRIENGYAVLSDRPGNGLDGDDQTVARHRLDGGSAGRRRGAR
jgi:mandelate racemase